MANKELDTLFKESINCYKNVSHKLQLVSDIYPFTQKLEMKPVPIDSKSQQAGEALRHAKDSEMAGLGILAKLINEMR